MLAPSFIAASLLQSSLVIEYITTSQPIDSPNESYSRKSISVGWLIEDRMLQLVQLRYNARSVHKPASVELQMQYCTSARWSVFSAPSLASPFLGCFGSQEQCWLSLSRHVHICAMHAYIGRACQSRSRLSCIMHSIRFISFMCWPDRQVERIWLILGTYIVLQKRSKCVFV